MHSTVYHHLSRTRFVATLGPASSEIEVLERMAQWGVATFRLNFSHSDHAWHRSTAQKVREVSKKLGLNLAILADLQGPKLRISSFAEGTVHLTAGQSFTLDLDLKEKGGHEAAVGIQYDALIQDVKAGDILVLDDGRLHLRIEEVLERSVRCQVLNDGELSDFKGLNKQGGGLSARSLTPKDELDLRCALELGADFIGVSFVKSASDILRAKALIQNFGSQAKVVAKIECAELVLNPLRLQEVLEATDAMMVARGDLAIEIGDAALTIAQKRLIQAAKQAGKPVITATQMMESMVEATVPTRAEVCDVSNAILDGTDAVMFSSETATGCYPVLVVKKAQEIALGVEASWSPEVSWFKPKAQLMALKPQRISDTLAIAAAWAVTLDSTIQALMVFTSSASSLFYLSSLVPLPLPILAISYSEQALRQTSLCRGVFPLELSDRQEASDFEACALKLAVEKGWLRWGDRVLLVHGDQAFKLGGSNTLRLLEAKPPLPESQADLQHKV